MGDARIESPARRVVVTVAAEVSDSELMLGRLRGHFYQCLTNVQRGRSICPNDLATPMEETNRAVLTAFETQVVSPDVIAAAATEALRRIKPSTDRARERERLRGELTRTEQELIRFTQAVADAGPLGTLLSALQEREQQRERLRAELAALDQLAGVADPSDARLAAQLRDRLTDWQGLLNVRVPQARQILRKLLVGRLVFTPNKDEAGRYYQFAGEGALDPILEGAVLP